MNVAVVYHAKGENTIKLAQDMAFTAHTHAIALEEFDFTQDIDLLLLGFDCRIFGYNHKIEDFVNQLSRKHIKNIALFSLFSFNDKELLKLIQLCQERDLPLMREQYCAKQSCFHKKPLDSKILEGGRVYVEDMLTICKKYY